MVKAGQTVGRERDKAEPSVPVAMQADAVQFPWTPRTDDRRAILVSERATVFDRPAEAVAKALVQPEIETAMGPLPSQWTFDLVHCRLLAVHAMACELPRVHVPPTYRSFLGNLQPSEAGRRRRVLTDEDTRRFDWTMSRVDAFAEIDRVVIKGVMSGHSLADVAKASVVWARRFGGSGLSKTSVHRRYRTVTTMMAAEWADLGEAIDLDTREVWLDRASRRP